MGKQFINDQWLETITCATCGVLFAMPTELVQKRRDNGKGFFCPNGHNLVFKASEADRLRSENARQKQMIEAAQSRASTAERNLGQVQKAHLRMRDRVANWVCPCCNRSFGNLRDHMKSEHPDFGEAKTLYALRSAFGMTQAAVAKEAGVNPSHVSLFERQQPVRPIAAKALERWMETYAAREAR